jgi:hypothetical protein
MPHVEVLPVEDVDRDRGLVIGSAEILEQKTSTVVNADLQRIALRAAPGLIEQRRDEDLGVDSRNPPSDALPPVNNDFDIRASALTS